MTSTIDFKEKISPFLKKKLDDIASRYGTDSSQYKGLAIQYVLDERELADCGEENLKHYEAGVDAVTEHGHLPGLERLYKKTLVIEPTLICSAHCRYCLRQNYGKHTLTEEQLESVAKYCGSPENREHLNEVLITGGDPMLIPKRMNFLLDALTQHAPNIRIIRIGTRLMTQNPDLFDDAAFSIFKERPNFRFEIATQINHPVEFFPETKELFKKLNDLGCRIYCQNVLLKGVNDNLETLVELYDTMRQHALEAHYLFHCVPMRGTHHLRTTVRKGLELVRGLSSGGRMSGRAKPMFAAMTDIGKIVFYEGTILEQKSGRLLLQSAYRHEDRLVWNPSWSLPDHTEVDPNGFLRVWYLDGEE